MKHPERTPKDLVNMSRLDEFFKRFFNRCAGTNEITDEEFAAFTKECFNECLNTFYGVAGYNYVAEYQDKFHDT